MKTTTNYVVGLGEVGTALTEYLNCEGRDLELNEEVETHALHIAYPWDENFIESVNRHIFEHSPRIVIVHSTVPVNTCDPHNWVHSPVTGQHPKLLESLHVFTKIFGGPRAIEAADLWPGNTHTTPLAANTEAGKLWELAQFAFQIKVNQRIHEWCEEHNLDPYVVYDLFATNYNRGYRVIGEPQFIRPVLEYMPGPIGGHCVGKGVELLGEDLTDLLADLL